MSELTTKLEQILEIKNELKTSITAKGSTVSNFESYPDGVDDISTGDTRTVKRVLIYTSAEAEETYDTYYDSPDDNTYTEVHEVMTWEYTADGTDRQLHHETYDYGGMPGYTDSDVWKIDGTVITPSSETDALNQLVSGTNILWTVSGGAALATQLSTWTTTYNVSAYLNGTINHTTETITHEPEQPEESGDEEQPEEEPTEEPTEE